MLLIAIVVAAILLVTFLAWVAFKSPSFSVTRSVVIAAPPEKIFPFVNDFHRWADWSPWEKIDPALQRTYTAPEAGVGASYAWTGNRSVGSGRMTITESRPFEHIHIRLEFLQPFPGVCEVDFRFRPRDRVTEVEWSMSGEHTLLPRLICTFLSMDKMVGGQYEKGLVALRTLAEG